MSQKESETTPAEGAESLARTMHGIDLDLLDAALDEVRPALQADGGDMTFRGIDEDGVVSVELTGACATCPLSAMTLVFGIEQMVLLRVPGVAGVTACSPAIPELSS